MAVAVSVVVAVHGVAEVLPACLDSLLSQRIDEPSAIEVIAVDDASPDGAGQLLDGYAARDLRLRVIHLDTNVGLGAARNHGLDRARGSYVWFVDGDDLLAPDALAPMLDRLRSHRPDVLLLGHARLGVDGVARDDPSAPARILPAVSGVGTVRQYPALLRVRQAAWNRVVSRSLLDRTGLRFPSGWYEDVAYSHLVLVAADAIAVDREVRYLYRDRELGAITRTRSARHLDIFMQYERMFSTLDDWAASDRLRARLFARMVDHYLVVAGARDRLPEALRCAFFVRMAEHYARYRPVGGYPRPGGWAGVRHELVRRRAYRILNTAQWVKSRGRFARRDPVGWPQTWAADTPETSVV